MRSLLAVLGLCLFMFGNLSCIGAGLAETTGEGTPAYWKSNCEQLCKEKTFKVKIIATDGRVCEQEFAPVTYSPVLACECGTRVCK